MHRELEVARAIRGGSIEAYSKEAGEWYRHDRRRRRETREETQKLVGKVVLMMIPFSMTIYAVNFIGVPIILQTMGNSANFPLILLVFIIGIFLIMSVTKLGRDF